MKILLLTLLTNQAIACTGCMGNSKRDIVLLTSICVFILLIYIPMFYLYKLVKNNEHMNQAAGTTHEQSNTDTEAKKD